MPAALMPSLKFASLPPVAEASTGQQTPASRHPSGARDPTESLPEIIDLRSLPQGCCKSGNELICLPHIAATFKEASVPIVETVAREFDKLPVLGSIVRCQTELALVVRKRRPLAVLQGQSKARLSDGEIEQFVIPQRTHRCDCVY